MMKSNNYEGWCDRGYKRKSPKNSDRLIEQGLVLCSGTPEEMTPTEPTPTEPTKVPLDPMGTSE